MTKKKDSKKVKNKFVIIGMCAILVLLIATGVIVYVVKNNGSNIDESKYTTFESENFIYESYDSFQKQVEIYDNDSMARLIDIDKIKEDDFKDYNVVLSKYVVMGCSEEVKKATSSLTDDTLKIYYDVELSCGVCAPYDEIRAFKVPKEIKKVETYYRGVNHPHCDEDITYKPMIYIYPEEEMDLVIKLGNPNYLISTYPEYNNGWNVHVSVDGNIYDYNTKRNYYALFWDAYDNTKNDMSEGFVVKGEDTIPFLEEKLAYLGLSEREINEFIVYWINSLDNEYNYIYFRTTEEVNEYMPLEFSKNPDTLIRVIVDMKPLNEKINVKEQSLESIERTGFTVVEWGGRVLN